MTPWMRRLHKWLGLLIGLQLSVWVLSGLGMSLLDHDQVEAHAFRAPAATPRPWPQDVLPAAALLAQPSAAATAPVRSIASAWLLDRPVYQARGEHATQLWDAATGAPLRIDAALAKRLAEASYTGPGRAQPPRLLERTLEARKHEGRLWRVDFDDAQDTTVYLSAQTGEVLEHRNRTWRLFDVLWMLHIMDYSGREDINNPLLVTLGLGGLWLALSGAWLLAASFRVDEFIPRRWRGTRALAVHSPDGALLRTVPAARGDTVFLAMGRQGLQLPSNCGGGQSCGLCEVRVCGEAPPPTAADRTHLSEAKLAVGHRLACNLPVKQDLRLEVAGGAGLWTEHGATVERIRAVTPFLREIVLRPDLPPGADYRPGSYLQIHVPDYHLSQQAIVQPEPHRQDWDALELPPMVRNRGTIRRSYSLSLPVDAADGCLTLLTRFNPGPRGTRHPPGRGSTWLYTLKPGDRVAYSAPFGDFALKAGGREKVFIGGGAGMAPLRAMVHTLLAQGARERLHFWYGARSLREAPYVEEMAQLAQRHANFSWHLVLSEAAECDDGLLRGWVHEAAHEHLLRAHPDLHACEFYLCGPPPMLAATRQLFERLGVAEERIAYDDFKV